MTESAKPPKDAIPIGDGKWIEFIDLTGRYDAAVDIDPLLVELEPLWSALETQCVAECCGLDAFDFYPDNILCAKDKVEIGDMCRRLSGLRDALNNLGASVVVSRRLNNYADIAVFNALVSHLQTHLCA